MLTKEHVDSKIAALKGEATAAVDAYNAYANEVTESLRGILREAGVLEEIESVEKERNDARAALEKKLQELSARAAELIKMKALIEEMEASVPALPTEDPAPEPVADVGESEPPAAPPPAAPPRRRPVPPRF